MYKDISEREREIERVDREEGVEDVSLWMGGSAVRRIDLHS